MAGDDRPARRHHRQGSDQPVKITFNYDAQEYAYRRSSACSARRSRICRTDGAVDAAYLAHGDKLYNGDRTKWLKLAYGMLALNLNHYSNKARTSRPT